MVRQIRIAVLDVDIPARVFYERRGLYSTVYRQTLQNAASHLNQKGLTEEIHIIVTPYDIRGGHIPDLNKLRRDTSQASQNGIVPIEGILVTGGDPGVHQLDHSPWMKNLVAFLQTVHNDFPHVRLMGTCFGHQILAHALVRHPKDSVRDVWVEKCPLGNEVGIYHVELSDAFVKAFPQALQHLPERHMRIQMFHGDRVMAVQNGTQMTLTESPPVSLPAPWINIGSTPICPIQGLYHPGRALTIQGHYEMDAFGMREMCVDHGFRVGWGESKLALFLDQIGPDVVERQDDGDAFAEAVVLFLAGTECS